MHDHPKDFSVKTGTLPKNRKAAPCMSLDDCTNENRCVDGGCVCGTQSGCLDAEICDWINNKCVSSEDVALDETYVCSCATNADEAACDEKVAG